MDEHEPKPEGHAESDSGVGGGGAVYIDSDTIHAAIRRLAATPVASKGHTVALGFLVLKARGGSEESIPIAATGTSSVRAELDRFFALAPGTTRPYLNPFGKLEWLRPGYERSGPFTQLYLGRALRPFVDVTEDNGRIAAVGIPPDGAERVAGALGERLPLRAAAAFLLRSEPFDAPGSVDAVVDRLRSVFRLSQDELDKLFVVDADFDVRFGDAPFPNSLDSLALDLRPQAPRAANIGVGGLAPSVTKDEVEVEGLVVPPAVLRRLRRALASSTGVAIAGPPGTGKSSLARQVIGEAQAAPDGFGLTQAPSFSPHTAEADWTARTLIGGHYPDGGELRFQPGIVLRAIAQNEWLVIDELNRADLDRVMGPLFSFLARQDVDLGPSVLGGRGKQMRLEWDDTTAASRCIEDDHTVRYLAGFDWRVIGTYNTTDLGRVFSMGSALTRRWATVPFPPLDADQLRTVLEQKAGNTPAPARERIVGVYETHLAHQPLGPAAFVQMARYVGAGGADDGNAAAGATTGELLGDAYVLFVRPQLRRLDPARRAALVAELEKLLPDVAAELAVD